MDDTLGGRTFFAYHGRVAEREQPRIVSVSSVHVIGEWRGHALAVWNGAPSIDATRALASTVERLASQRPGRASYLAQIRPSPVLPEEPVRRSFIDLGRKVSETLNCIGIVVEGQGFGAAAIRAFVTGLGLAASIRFPLRSFSTPEAMVAWARPRLIAAQSDPGSEHEILAAFDYLAAQLPP